VDFSKYRVCEKLRILFHNFYDSLNKKNILFNDLNTSIGDNLLAPFHELLRQANKRNIVVGTSDVIEITEADALVFLDYPDSSNPKVRSMLSTRIPKYLVVFESPLVRQLPSKVELLGQFNRVFTYDDSLVDGDRILKINYSFNLPKKIVAVQRVDKKLLTLIAGNKKCNSLNELYSKRLEAINWFDKNAPDEFDFYGVGWGLFDFGPLQEKIQFLGNINLRSVMKMLQMCLAILPKRYLIVFLRVAYQFTGVPAM